MAGADVPASRAHPQAKTQGLPGLLDRSRTDSAFGAFILLRVGFVALPLLMGLDKFFNLMTHWTLYLAPWIVDIIPFSAGTAMKVVGIVEIGAAVMVAIKPRYAAKWWPCGWPASSSTC